MVHQCPKLITKFAITPDGSMSARSEVLLIWLDFLSLFLCVCFMFPFNNKTYKLKWVWYAWIALQTSQVAEDSSSNREWTRDNGWKEDGQKMVSGDQLDNRWFQGNSNLWAVNISGHSNLKMTCWMVFFRADTLLANARDFKYSIL
jgi:hypothetical protein